MRLRHKTYYNFCQQVIHAIETKHSFIVTFQSGRVEKVSKENYYIEGGNPIVIDSGKRHVKKRSNKPKRNSKRRFVKSVEQIRREVGL